MSELCSVKFGKKCLVSVKNHISALHLNLKTKYPQIGKSLMLVVVELDEMERNGLAFTNCFSSLTDH